MKAIYLLVCAMTLCAIQPSRSDDACCASPTAQVEARLREIDIKVMLSVYEQYRTEAAKAEVALILMRVEADGSQSAEKQKLEQKLEMLNRFSANTRAQILKLGGEVEVAAK